MPRTPNCMSRSTFLEEYELGFDKEFVRNGKAAVWAPAQEQGPRLWGDANHTLDLTSDGEVHANVPSASMSVSPDGRFVAASTNAVIRLYNLDTLGQKAHSTPNAELVGHVSNVWKTYFVPVPSNPIREINGKRVAYLLLSSGATVGGRDGEIILWSLDADGRPITRSMPFAIETLTDNALGAVEQDLRSHHDVSDEELKKVRDGFKDVLKGADTRNRRAALPHRAGQFPSYNTGITSADGRYILYKDHSGTTQHGMRPPDELPQIVVYNLETNTERCRLKAHEDTIIWAEWSPTDNNVIATASWDQTYKIWNAETGEIRHTIGPTDGQNWAGAFSPDGKYVLLSGGSPTKVAIYEVESGKEVSVLDIGEKRARRGWIRQIAWHPKDTDCVALSIGQSVILWHPFANQESEDTEEEVLKLKNDGSMLDGFCSISCVKWLDQGKLLAVETSENSVCVYECLRRCSDGQVEVPTAKRDEVGFSQR